MRKLLVASQKGGVGKTTTSINLSAACALAGTRVLLLDADPLSNVSMSLNLSAHPNNQPLRQAGVDLPGVLVSGVLPGLDVLSPYMAGGCSDDELDHLLALVASPAVQDAYGTLIVDTPPFLGANPGQLLATCDEFITVMRAEPMAYRTLPAFLELVSRSRGQREVTLRGILLTLPEGENPGGRWERELRGRLGSRILPLVMPFDETAAQAALFGQIVSHANPESIVSQTYRALIETLALAVESRSAGERLTGAAALAAAALTVKVAPRTAPTRTAPATAPKPAAAPTPAPAPEVPAPEVFSPSRRRTQTPTLPLPTVPRRTSPARAAEPAPPQAALPVAAKTAAEASNFPMGMGAVFVALAIVVGVGMRFLKLPDYMVPMLVGVGVGAVVVVLARYLLVQEEKKPAATKTAAPPAPVRQPGSSPRLGLQRRPKSQARHIDK